MKRVISGLRSQAMRMTRYVTLISSSRPDSCYLMAAFIISNSLFFKINNNKISSTGHHSEYNMKTNLLRISTFSSSLLIKYWVESRWGTNCCLCLYDTYFIFLLFKEYSSLFGIFVSLLVNARVIFWLSWASGANHCCQ